MSAALTDTATRINEDHVEHWLRHGYVVVEDFLTADELAAARDNASRYLPTWEEYQAAPERYGPLLRSTPALPGLVANEFPYVGDALNDVTFHPELVRFAQQTLGTPDIFLTQSILWGKYAGVGDFEQPHHVDLGNNTLVVPRHDSGYRQLPFILYLTDVTEAHGPTAVVSRELTPERDLQPYGRHRDRFPELYDKEVAVAAPAGSLLLYSMKTFHRGTRFTAAEGMRMTLHLVYTSTNKPWMGFIAHARNGNLPAMKHFLERATPEQRAMIGFPAVGDPYWNDETLAGVAARYPGMDMAPYRQANT